jgi:Flp pilus assembly protein TadG
MMARKRGCVRSGGTMVEFAIVAPLLFMIIFGILIGSMVVFCYQELSRLSSEVARYGSVHAATWAKEQNNNVLLTQQNIFDNVLLPRSFMMNAATLEAGSTLWYDDPSQQIQPSYSAQKQNRIHVTLQYPANAMYPPLLQYFSSITLSSTSERVLSY